ncbi:hypothetical protein DM01DRAFT_1027132 [Hesseltinella vesiculosa]|uniref:Transcription factor domain-containing protein n=1 Tax=Hesseltinella vesiculosa TaxID=101127 RepID=A0A1X2GKG1_9FUNG|nr:hypothetical protein DM01DRAFT_1027132 [Hesseltinella vesiculosa]
MPMEGGKRRQAWAGHTHRIRWKLKCIILSRCERVRLPCVYIKSYTPCDLELIERHQEDSLAREVVVLANQIDALDQQLQYHRQQTASDVYQAQQSTTASRADGPQWTLEVTRSGMCFKVPIKTHRDLTAFLQQIYVATQFIPPNVDRYSSWSSITCHLIMQLKHKFSKTQYRVHHQVVTSVARLENIASSAFSEDHSDCPSLSPSSSSSLPSVSSLSSHTPPHTTASPDTSSTTPTSEAQMADSIADVAPGLLKVYLSCLHPFHWAVEPATLTNMIHQHDPTTNPARTAFCAYMCATPTPCSHLEDVLPRHLRRSYANAFYEAAHDLVADLFDQPSLDTLTAYVMMSIYHHHCLDETSSDRYADMACRIAMLLMDTYPPNPPSPSSSTVHQHRTHFARLMLFLHRERGGTLKYPHWQSTLLGLEADAFQPTPTENKTIATMHQYNADMSHVLGEYLHRLRGSSGVPGFVMQGLVITLSLMIETNVKKWYSSLSPDYQLRDLPLLEAWSMTDDEYIQHLTTQPLLPVFMTLAVYKQLILLGLACIPKQALNNSKTDFWQAIMAHPDLEDMASPVAQHSASWRRRIWKYRKLREDTGFNGTDEEFLTVLGTIYKWGDGTSARLQYPIINAAIHATVNSIRLCRHLRQHQHERCFSDKRIIALCQFFLQQLEMCHDYLPLYILRIWDQAPRYILLCDAMLDS